MKNHFTKRVRAVIASFVIMVAFTSCGTFGALFGSGNTQSQVATPSSSAPLGRGTASIYDFDNFRLHVIYTGDPLEDYCFVVESTNNVIAIEMPSFTQDLDAWLSYITRLDKKFEDIFISAHPTGKSYVQNKNVYGTVAARAAIANGSTFDTTDALYKQYGTTFHGGPNMVSINSTVNEGYITIDGVRFQITERGDYYDIAIPQARIVFTHMLGKYTHSLLTSTTVIDNMVSQLTAMKLNGYTMVLSAHAGAEGQDAITEKLLYVEQANLIRAGCLNSAEYITMMNRRFSKYTGFNYLQQSGEALFPMQQ